MSNSGEIVIYTADNGTNEIEVRLVGETIWLSQRQMSELFGKDQDTIGLHLKNIYLEGELVENLTTEDSSVVQLEGKRRVKRQVKLYNLDAILSVGYRVNSKRGTEFRIWANKIIKNYLIKGYLINENLLQNKRQQLAELQQAVRLLGNVMEKRELNSEEATGLLKVITDYSYALDILDKYDHQLLETGPTNNRNLFEITYPEAINAIANLKSKFGGSKLFGNEKDESFKGSLAAIYQTFEGKDLYPSVEEKAANLIYFIIKNHSFSDGNKRIAAFLFVWFLEKNKILYHPDGSKKIADNALVALTLMIAESKPDEKSIMTKVVINLINEHN